MSDELQMPSKCRILFLIGEMVAGGQEVQLCYLIQEMDRERFQPVLVVWNYRESDVNMPKVRSLGIPIRGFAVGTPSYKKLYALMQLARRLRPEVVHSCGFYTNFAAFCAARAAGAVAVGAIRNELDPGALMATRPILGRLSAALPRHQISNSERAKERIEAAGGWGPRELTVVSNRLDVGRFRCEPIPTESPCRILGLGSLVPFKRWDRLLRVGRELKLRNIAAHIQLAGSGPSQEELEALASSLGIETTTHFLGYREDIPDVLAQARIVVHCSDGEGMPNVIMEAMASGRPVVATGVGDVPKLIENGKTGFVVAPNDEEGLLARVIDLISNDELASRLGNAAREYALREFGVSRLVTETWDVYRAAGWNS